MEGYPSRRFPNFHGSYRFIAPAWEQALEDIGLSEKTDWSNFNAGNCVAGDAGSRTQVYRINTINGSIFFKKYKIRSRWRYFMRPGKAASEWTGLTKLGKAGVAVPELVAFGEDRHCGRLESGFIITREIDNACDLASFALERWFFFDQDRKHDVKNQIKNQLYSQIRTAHQSGLYHRDLMWRNILVQEQHGQFKLWWIDCPRLVSSPFKRPYLEMVDLSCLSRLALSIFSRSQRMRLLIDFYDGDRAKARNIFIKIVAHHKRSKNQPKIFVPQKKQKKPGITH